MDALAEPDAGERKVGEGHDWKLLGSMSVIGIFRQHGHVRK